MSPEVSALRLPSVHELAPWLDGSDDVDVLSVATDVEDARAAGYADGFAAGREDGEREGRRAGLAAGREEASAALERATGALLAAATDLAGRDAFALRAVSVEVADLAVAVVEGLLGRELAALDEPARAAVERALALAPERGAVVARLHPDDRASVAEVAEALAPGREVELVADPAVEPGGAVVEVGACRIDAQLSTAVARVREVLAP
jgi:flagellar assembly protein FliH